MNDLENSIYDMDNIINHIRGNCIELMNEKHYIHYGDITISDLKELGECVTDNMSIGALLECAEILYDEAMEE